MKTLKNVLLINSLSSGATGLGLVAVPGLLANLFDTYSSMPFIGTGVFLLVFAGMVLFESRKSSLSPYWVRLIIILDTLWVVGSLAIVLTKAFDLSGLGYLLIGVIALWVALMAYLQFQGLKRIKMFTKTGIPT